jgi:putative SOS response-associated peptidase YedK
MGVRALDGEEVPSATIIVGEPNPLLDGIHDRMPVMLMPEDYDRWLDPTMAIDDLRAMFKPYYANLMKAYEVSRAVNSVKNDTPECVEPLTPPGKVQ